MADSLAALRSTRRGHVPNGKGAVLILAKPRAGAGAGGKEVVGAAEAAMAREREGSEGIAETGGCYGCQRAKLERAEDLRLNSSRAPPSLLQPYPYYAGSSKLFLQGVNSLNANENLTHPRVPSDG